MPECDKFQKAINEMLDYGIKPDNELILHMDNCSGCRDFYALYKSFRLKAKERIDGGSGSIKSFDSMIKPESKIKNVYNSGFINIFKILSPAVLLFIILFFLVFYPYYLTKQTENENKDFVASILNSNIIEIDNDFTASSDDKEDSLIYFLFDEE